MELNPLGAVPSLTLPKSKRAIARHMYRATSLIPGEADTRLLHKPSSKKRRQLNFLLYTAQERSLQNFRGIQKTCDSIWLQIKHGSYKLGYYSSKEKAVASLRSVARATRLVKDLLVDIVMFYERVLERMRRFKADEQWMALIGRGTIPDRETSDFLLRGTAEMEKHLAEAQMDLVAGAYYNEELVLAVEAMGCKAREFRNETAIMRDKVVTTKLYTGWGGISDGSSVWLGGRHLVGPIDDMHNILAY